ncbi:MAG: GAF domain-containing protein [Janthinobacterium lividum]
MINSDTAFSVPGDPRLRALLTYGILDTPPQAAFDDLARLAAQVCAAPTSFITFVDDHRQFFKASFGAGGVHNADLETGFCPFTVSQRQTLIIPDALADPRFRDNPAAQADPPIRFYAGVPLTTPEGHVLGTLCVVDLVPRELEIGQLDALSALARQVETQLALRQAAGQRAALAAAQQEVNQIAHDLDAVLTIVARRTEVLAGADGAAVMMIDGDEMVCRAVSAGAVSSLGLRVKREDSVSGRCVGEGRVLSCEDTQTDLRSELETYRGFGVRSLVLLPLLFLGRAVGTLNVYSSQPNAFSADVLPLLELMVSMVVAAMSGAAEAEARRVLALTEERQQFAMEGVGIGTWYTDIGTGSLVWSPRCKALFGLPPEAQMTQALFYQRIYPEDRPEAEAIIAQSLAEGSIYDLECRVMWPDGSVRWIAARGRGYKDAAGRPARFEGTMQDIDERKRAGERQRQFLRDVLASVTEGHLVLCDTAADLPVPPVPFGPLIPLSMNGGLRELRQAAEGACLEAGFTDERCYDLVTAAHEAGMNAAVHVGNGEGQIAVDAESDTILVRIADSGAGISMENLPHATLMKGYSSAGTLGHGMKMMLQTADRVFLLTGTTGTTVMLEMQRVASPAVW